MPNQLRDIRNFTELVRYLETELDWPVNAESFDDLTFEYVPAELGLKEEDAVKIKKIYQLRPLVSGQPWGIFFIEFEKKKLPVVVLRCILSHLVVKKRQSANKADQAVWNPEDLLFISAFGDEASDQREIAFAHFHQQAGDLPTLNVLGWDGSDTPLKLDYVAGQLKDQLHWPQNPKDQETWRTQWRTPFRHRIGHVIRTADSLAEVLAALARGIRDRCKIKMRAESEHGALTKLYQGFQTALIHDLKPEDFADTYAQTITYGLLTAAISRTEMSEGRYGTVLHAENVTDMVPVTNPFLKEMLQTFLKVGGRKGGIDFDELGIQDVVELLRGDETDLPAVLRDFGNKTRGEDPVIHFYEHFLSAYNKKLKIQRGVFYTPQPVVSYIVRSVHELLQTEFGLEEGLASTVTWGEMIARNLKHAANVSPASSSPTGVGEDGHRPGEGRPGENKLSAGVGRGEGGLKLPKVNDPGEPDKTISPDEFFVQILDPATGTATFLVEVIDVIFKHLKVKWDQDGLKAMPKLPAPASPSPVGTGEGVRRADEGRWAENQFSAGAAGSSPIVNFSDYWNQYVPLALLPRLYGYELMMAPYAIAHMKIGLKLHETGYHFGTEERARIYLTNALEPKVTQLPQIGFEALAHEAAAVNEIKWYKRFTVVIGNPPYSVNSANRTEFTERLIEPYLAGLKERYVKPLHDDYIKFVAFAQHELLKCPASILGMITNNGYLGGVIHRKMRETMLKAFQNLHVVDLHGNALINDRTESGLPDENVFDIQQGVAIIVATKRASDDKPEVRVVDLRGDRQAKYDWLAKTTARADNAKVIAPKAENYFFTSTIFTNQDEYDSFPELRLLFPDSSIGILTNRDWLVVAFSRDELVSRLESFFDPKMTDAELAARLPELNADGWWDYKAARRPFLKKPEIERAIVKVLYRPFDVRYIFLSSRLVNRPRLEVMEHMLKPNMALIISRITKNDFDSCFVSNLPIEQKCAESTRGVYCMPLYSWQTTDDLLGGSGKQCSIPHKYLSQFPSKSPEDIFHYAYGVFHSPGYRSRYAEFLKIDFPRLPLTGNLELFRALARLGGELTALHLLESPKLAQPITEYVGARSPEVEKISWSKNTVWLDKAQTTGFQGVREDVWNFHIGGYQVCEKWLKDRKGRTITAADRTHYQKIVVALSETIRLMKEIDAVIETHGGWPLK